MQLSIDQKDIDKFLMIGGEVLIKPKNPQSQTKTGLYMHHSEQQGEKVQEGYIKKTGPGNPLPTHSEEKVVVEKKKGAADPGEKEIAEFFASTDKEQVSKESIQAMISTIR